MGTRFRSAANNTKRTRKKNKNKNHPQCAQNGRGRVTGRTRTRPTLWPPLRGSRVALQYMHFRGGGRAYTSRYTHIVYACAVRVYCRCVSNRARNESFCGGFSQCELRTVAAPVRGPPRHYSLLVYNIQVILII